MKLRFLVVLLGCMFVATLASARAGEKNVDRREERQKHRIAEGIKHGQLTPEELSKLEKQEANIKAMQKDFQSDGKVTKDEGKKLEGALNDASLQIWAQRHDMEGNQKEESRLGKDVFANDEITKQIESGEMTHAQARDFLTDVHRMVRLKHRLSADELSDGQRTNLSNEYNELLNKYFTMK